MIIDKLKGFIGVDSIDEEGNNFDQENSDYAYASAFEDTNDTGNLNEAYGGSDARSQLIIFEPRDYSESIGIANHLLTGKGCIMNLHQISKEDAQRIIDFIYGIVFAIKGNIQKIGSNIFLVTPNNFGVMNDSE